MNDQIKTLEDLIKKHNLSSDKEDFADESNSITSFEDLKNLVVDKQNSRLSNLNKSEIAKNVQDYMNDHENFVFFDDSELDALENQEIFVRSKNVVKEKKPFVASTFISPVHGYLKSDPERQKNDILLNEIISTKTSKKDLSFEQHVKNISFLLSELYKPFKNETEKYENSLLRELKKITIEIVE